MAQRRYSDKYPSIKVKLFDEVAATGTSESRDVFIYKQLTVVIVATGISTGGGATFRFQGGYDDSNFGTLMSVRNTGVADLLQNVKSNGTYIFEVMNASTIHYFRLYLESRTDGTYTAYLLART